MAEENGKEKFIKYFITIHIISLSLATVTGIITDLLKGLISYLVYIHLSAAMIYWKA